MPKKIYSIYLRKICIVALNKYINDVLIVEISINESTKPKLFIKK